MRKIIAETNRLIIREITMLDVDDMLALHSDPEIHRYLGNKTINNREEIVKVIHSLRDQYHKYNVGRWAMIDKQSTHFIGWTGLEMVTKKINNHTNYYDLGYRLKKEYWGQGYATESAFASVDYGFSTLDIPTIYAIADIDNVGSNAVLKKVGLQWIQTFDLEGVQHNWYKLEKSDLDLTIV